MPFRAAAPAPMPLYSSPTLLPALDPAWHHTRIFSIYIAGSPTPSGGVHWRLFLQVSANPDKSVRVDCKPGGSDFHTGNVVLDPVNYAYSSKTVAIAKCNLAYPMTPETFRNMLGYYGLLIYRYAPGPKGCRFWCQTVLEYLTMLGFLAPGVKANFEQYIGNCHMRQPQRYPLPVIRGTFGKL